MSKFCQNIFFFFPFAIKLYLNFVYIYTNFLVSKKSEKSPIKITTISICDKINYLKFYNIIYEILIHSMNKN